MVDFADFGILRAKHEEMERRMAAMELAHRLAEDRLARMEFHLGLGDPGIVPEEPFRHEFPLGEERHE